MLHCSTNCNPVKPLGTISSRECVEISSIPEVKDENTNDIVIKVGSLTGLDLMKNDVSASHRLPKPSHSAAVRKGPQSSSNTPSRASDVVVKFVRRETRDRFYEGRKLSTPSFPLFILT